MQVSQDFASYVVYVIVSNGNIQNHFRSLI